MSGLRRVKAESACIAAAGLMMVIDWEAVLGEVSWMESQEGKLGLGCCDATFYRYAFACTCNERTAWFMLPADFYSSVLERRLMAEAWQKADASKCWENCKDENRSLLLSYGLSLTGRVR
jgi:hypothetical protein